MNRRHCGFWEMANRQNREEGATEYHWSPSNHGRTNRGAGGHKKLELAVG